MLIRQRGTLKKFDPRPGTPNQEAYTVIQVVVATAQFTDGGQIADGYRYVGHTIEVTLKADALPMPLTAERPMETLWSRNGQGERTRPGPTETCSECGCVIGDDPEAAFYTPIAGPPRPVCGACALELDDSGIAEEAEAEEWATDGDVTQFEYPEGHVVTLNAEGEVVAASGDQPIGDRPLPERPGEAQPITTPIRRGRARVGS